MGGELERQSTDVGRGGRWKEWCKRSTRAILNRASYLLYVSLYMCGLFREWGQMWTYWVSFKVFLGFDFLYPPRGRY